MSKLLKKDSLMEMKNLKGEWCVSLYLPVSRTDTQKNRIRLRNLMFDAEKKLIELGTSIITVAKILLPIEIILDNNKFWKNKEPGLAIFLAPDSFNWYSLSSAQKLTVISNRFYLKPLQNFRRKQLKARVQNLIWSKNYSERIGCQSENASVF